MQQLTRFQLTQRVTRFLCGGGASCHNLLFAGHLADPRRDGLYPPLGTSMNAAAVERHVTHVSHTPSQTNGRDKFTDGLLDIGHTVIIVVIVDC